MAFAALCLGPLTTGLSSWSVPRDGIIEMDDLLVGRWASGRRSTSKAQNTPGLWDIAVIGEGSIRTGYPVRRRVTTHADAVNTLKYTREWNQNPRISAVGRNHSRVPPAATVHTKVPVLGLLFACGEVQSRGAV